MVKFSLQLQRYFWHFIAIVHISILFSIPQVKDKMISLSLFPLISGLTSIPWTIPSLGVLEESWCLYVCRFSRGSPFNQVSCCLHLHAPSLPTAMLRLMVVIPLNVAYVETASGSKLRKSQEPSAGPRWDTEPFKQRRWREGTQPGWAAADRSESTPSRRSLHTSCIYFQEPGNQPWIPR